MKKYIVRTVQTDKQVIEIPESYSDITGTPPAGADGADGADGAPGISVWEDYSTAAPTTSDAVTWVTAFTLSVSLNAMATYTFLATGIHDTGLSLGCRSVCRLGTYKTRVTNPELVTETTWWSHGPDGESRFTVVGANILCQVRGGGAYTTRWSCKLMTIHHS
jgi:hypothetical protein